MVDVLLDGGSLVDFSGYFHYVGHLKGGVNYQLNLDPLAL